MKTNRLLNLSLTVLLVVLLSVFIPLVGCSVENTNEADEVEKGQSPSISIYTITYDLDGGTVDVENKKEYTEETEDFTLTNPTKTGYTFSGWSGTGITGTSTEVIIVKGSTGNKTYHANWTANTYTVTLNTNGATSCADLTSYTYGVGATLPTPEKTNYEFGGWYENATFSGTPKAAISATATGNKTYYAKWTEITPMEKSLKILAIGNSFSIDAMEYVYSIAKFAGYDEIVLGNLYIGGCSLQTHADNIKNDAKKYRYFKSNPTMWIMTETGTSESSFVAISDVIGTEQWDYVSLQQNSDNSGRAESYDESLSYIINYVKTNVPKAKIIWHMTWAYPHNSAHTAYKNYYNQDQTTMYNGIIKAVTTKIVPNADIYCVLPVGTAVQNARTSFIGDNFSRDELHLSVDNGRLIAAMTWVAKLTGYDLTTLDYAKVSSVIKDERTFNVLVESVVNAISNPYEVTQSSDPFDSEVKSDAIKSLLAENGYNAEDYYRTNPRYTFNAYWNSSATASEYNGNIKSTMFSRYIVPDSATFKKFICTGKFKRSEIPVGSIIILLDGAAQYRPDGWVNTDDVTTVRPDNVTSSFVVVDDLWWGSFTVRGFNISLQNMSDLSEEQMQRLAESFAILVPKNPIKQNLTVTTNKRLISDGQTNVRWSFGDDYYTDGTLTSVKVASTGVTYNFVYNNKKLSTKEDYKHFCIILGPSNPNGQGAPITWNGGFVSSGQVKFKFMVNPDTANTCRLFVIPLSAEDEASAYSGYDWQFVGSCSEGGEISFSISIQNNGDNYSLFVSGSGNSNDFSDYLQNVSGNSFMNSSRQMNIAVQCSDEVYGNLDFVSYSGRSVSNILSDSGYSLNNYTRLGVTLVENAFYNPVNSTAITSPTSDNTSVYYKFATTNKILSKSELPDGTLIVIADGYKYRPDGWINTSITIEFSKRANEVSASVMVVDSAWWGEFNYRTFNISRADGLAMTAQEMASVNDLFHILVPKA